MRTLLQDFRFAVRLLSGSPAFTAVAVLTLAVGIASTTTVFSWIDSLLLHPFHGAARAGELAVLEMSIPGAPNGGTSVAWLDYTDFRDHLTLASGVTLQRYCALSLGDSRSARPAWGELVSANYFDVLGIQPVQGRLYLPDRQPVAVISERLWRNYFRGDPAIVGKAIRINRQMLTVGGIAPAIFRGTAPAMLIDLWLPATFGVELSLMSQATLRDRSERDFASMIVRLKPGVSMSAAQSEVAAIAAARSAEFPLTNRGVSALLLPPWRAHSGTGDLLLAPLRILMAVSLVLLLIVCANVANLLLARSVARQREFGVRLAMGASRWRVARQLMTETLLLAVLGVLAGIVILPWMWGSLLALVPNVGLPIAREFDFSPRIAAFTALCGVLSALAAGAAPALFSARANLNEVLKEGGRGGHGGVTHRTRSLLVVSEVALAAVAIAGAGLFARSFQNARKIHPGFDTTRVLFGRFFMDGSGLTADQQAQFALRLRRALETEPGIESVSYSDFTPLSTTAGPYAKVQPEGYTRSPGESTNVNRARVAPGYFAALRIPLLAGRDFADSDRLATAPVMIVNQTFAARYFPKADPLGRRVKLYGKWITIVGVARDSKYFTPAESPKPHFYVPFSQGETVLRELDVFIRTAGDPPDAIPLLRHAAISAGLASYHAVPLSEYIQVALFGQRVAASLMASLGVMCLFLAVLGLYSVMTCAVNQRAQEIGVRMALGARPSNVIRMVVGQGMAMVMVGIAAGSVIALAAARLAAAMLIHVSASDPLTFIATALFLAAAALLATYIPARRATRIDPMIALRQQ
jgi:predicted permease